MVPPDASQQHAVYQAVDLNFRLRQGSKAVDAAVPMQTVNDEFRVRAPDLGALEVGRLELQYGLMSLTSQLFYG